MSGDIATITKAVGPLKKGTVLRILERNVKTAIGLRDRVRWCDDDCNAHESPIRSDCYKEVSDA